MSQTHDHTHPDDGATPGVVIGAVAAATAVVPFLIVYAFLFVARGVFVQVEQPDITSSRHGEALAGLVAVLFLVLVVWGNARLLNGAGRLVFWAGQLITLGGSVWCVLDTASGQPQVPVVTALAALLALALSLTPAAARWVRGQPGAPSVAGIASAGGPISSRQG